MDSFYEDIERLLIRDEKDARNDGSLIERNGGAMVADVLVDFEKHLNSIYVGKEEEIRLVIEGFKDHMRWLFGKVLLYPSERKYLEEHCIDKEEVWTKATPIYLLRLYTVIPYVIREKEMDDFCLFAKPEKRVASCISNFYFLLAQFLLSNKQRYFKEET